MHSSARELGASLVLLRKAKNFSLWIQKESRPPYMLITNWREAQPCMEAVESSPCSTRPVSMIVMCDSARQYHHVHKWASESQNTSMVHVYERDCMPANLIADLVNAVFCQPPQAGGGGRGGGGGGGEGEGGGSAGSAIPLAVADGASSLPAVLAPPSSPSAVSLNLEPADDVPAGTTRPPALLPSPAAWDSEELYEEGDSEDSDGAAEALSNHS